MMIHLQHRYCFCFRQMWGAGLETETGLIQAVNPRYFLAKAKAVAPLQGALWSMPLQGCFVIYAVFCARPLSPGSSIKYTRIFHSKLPRCTELLEKSQTLKTQRLCRPTL